MTPPKGSLDQLLLHVTWPQFMISQVDSCCVHPLGFSIPLGGEKQKCQLPVAV